MHGLHLTADLHDCQCQARWLLDAEALGAACVASGRCRQACRWWAKLFHTFPATPKGPGGVTAAVLLAESHLCVHTWPEEGSVTLDVYVCNFGADHSAKAHAVMNTLEALFLPSHTETRARAVREPRRHRGRGGMSFPGASTIKAMILAAGRGERMRPLTDVTPKPLLEVTGKPLMQWPMEALATGGFTRLVVNTAWLGEQIPAHFGERFEGAIDHCAYSHEGRDFGGALETAGGIVRALPLLGDIFWVVAGDVFAPDFAFSRQAVDRFAAGGRLAHLWLVPNPAHNPQGDFGIAADGSALSEAARKHTFSTIALYRAGLFASPYCDIASGNPDGTKAALAPLLREAMKAGRISAERYTGRWADVGTPERLAELNTRKRPA